ncbi:MAG: glycosyltransferase [Cyclobacteriaceae bacterium]|nr:glycosyltransferase [Cyclobacteriaceae bacterium]
MSSKPIKLSVVIITLNEEKNIGKCLDAAWQVADEVVVVDSFSTDRTKIICEDLGVTFVEHKFEGYGLQKNYAINRTKFEHILSLDADEVLSQDLINSIIKVKQKGQFTAFQINRLSFYVKKFIEHGHWFPDKKIRLFNKSAGEWTNENVHETFELKNGFRTPVLKGVLYHYTFNSIFEHLRQSNNFSEIGAAQLKNQKIFFLSLKAILSPMWGFVYGYFVRLGFLDGWYGLIIAVISSNETFLKYSKAIMLRLEPSKIEKVLSKTPSTSLIISTYNWPEALQLSLQSIKQQRLLPNEVIIADDGSTNETGDLIEMIKESFPVPLIHCRIEDKGFRLAKARNEALKIAKFDYILQIDGDIILDKFYVQDQIKFARNGSFVRGSRVLLNKDVSQKIFRKDVSRPHVFMKGVVNFFNGIRLPLLQNFISINRLSIVGIRGCNMAYWKEDAFLVNGYNEDIQGWGREDSEFVARLVNNGIHKRNLRLGGIQYHIYHKEYDRELLTKNDDILNRTLDKKLISCKNGIEYLTN